MVILNNEANIDKKAEFQGIKSKFFTFMGRRRVASTMIRRRVASAMIRIRHVAFGKVWMRYVAFAMIRTLHVASLQVS